MPFSRKRNWNFLKKLMNLNLEKEMCKKNMRQGNDQRVLGLCQKEYKDSLKKPSLPKIWNYHKCNYNMCKGFGFPYV